MASNVTHFLGNGTDNPAVAGTRHHEYQEIKSRIHQELLNRINMQRLATVSRKDAETEIRGLIVSLLDRETGVTPLSLYERETLLGDVLNELFGLGPLEVLLHDSTISDILVNRHDQIYVEREGKLEPTEL